MGTRSGTIDPPVVTYIMKKEGLTAEEVEKVLNSKSGLLGLSGVSSDCRDVINAAKAGEHRSELAIKILVHYIKKIIGSYVAEMNGVDALVFTAGIGENDKLIRELVCRDLDYLGIEIDEAYNRDCERGIAVDISKAGAKVKTYAIPTNEEYMIALDTLHLAQ